MNRLILKWVLLLFIVCTSLFTTSCSKDNDEVYEGEIPLEYSEKINFFFEAEDKVRLQPRNENHPPMTIKGSRINGIYRAVIKYERL